MYPNISHILSCYFNQDSELEFDDPMEIIDVIVDGFDVGDRFLPAINELDNLLALEINIDDKFIFSLGLDAAPYRRDYENRNFLIFLKNRMAERKLGLSSRTQVT